MFFEKTPDRQPANRMAAFVQAHDQLAQRAALVFVRPLGITRGLRLEKFKQLSHEFESATAYRSFAQTSQLRTEPVATMADAQGLYPGISASLLFIEPAEKQVDLMMIGTDLRIAPGTAGGAGAKMHRSAVLCMIDLLDWH